MKEAEEAYTHLTRPFACIDLNALDRNIAFVNKEALGKDIRIATKSVRSTSLLRYIAERLNNHSGWMTFDLRKALYLLGEGFDELLFGYPQIEEAPLEEIIPYIQKGRSVVFMIDCIEQWRWLNEIGEYNEVVFEVCIDLNMSTDFKMIYFGTKRSSLRTVIDVENLLESGSPFANTKITGMMGYEAQLAGVTDVTVTRWQAPLVKELKKISRKKVSKLRKKAVAMVRSNYPTLRFVNGGGSGSIDFTAREEEVTELTIGSAFYFPALFSKYTNLPLENAVTFALRVTRNPEEGIVVCNGGGYVASGAVGVDKNPVPLWPENLTFLKNEGAGEVQTPLYDKEKKLQIGDTVYFRHAKAGELCERFNELHARRGTTYIESFMTYRGEGECYL